MKRKKLTAEQRLEARESQREFSDLLNRVIRREQGWEQASADVIEALELPIRETLLSGDIVTDIFEPQDFSDMRHVEYPLDILTPGQETEFVAYVHPGEGYVPRKVVEADLLMVPTYVITNAIDAPHRIIRNASWPIVSRMIEVLESGFVKKINDDGWQVILSAATNRNILVIDSNAANGQFTPKLVSLMKTIMRRNGGGNSGTLNRGRLTDLYVSPEAENDILHWGLDLVPDEIRTQIFRTNGAVQIYDVMIKALDELGEGQEYQAYYTTTLSGTMGSGDLEICVGLDRSKADSFVYPVVEELKLFEDNVYHRSGVFGLYGNTEFGLAVLDSRRTLLGSL